MKKISKSKTQEPNYRKQLYQGQKGTRGQPIYYEEMKERISLTLTPTAINQLAETAKKQGISKSELVERWARAQLVKNEEKPLEE